MSTNLIVLAAQRAFNGGKDAYAKELYSHSTFYVYEAFEPEEIDNKNLNEIFPIYAEECKSTISFELNPTEQKYIEKSLNIIKSINSQFIGTSIIQAYSDDVGILHTIMYSFNSINTKTTCSITKLRFNIKLPYKFVIARYSKTMTDDYSVESQEYSTISENEELIQALSIAFAPFIYEIYPQPYRVIDELKYQVNRGQPPSGLKRIKYKQSKDYKFDK
ncbi:hypothetical protein TVAG_300710 [Trichomonas vaginalis G3]|uniref:Uncharacterized protein n=1 Tax=Trichomonas vaginalis (strain ATCC PRA-98 / G3) TaxID=412133 RepID=A2EP51_TRIV3|nr:hypothetical protein TVAGG3_0154940 [Trichomonas vaginalis G3]EAY05589.1 hypothetical protein TVAG_300710 [Trichomonas vaginalis G3]KAI5547507.1 hypothetical protein TVAGG3_0154940 [Trichomonas vaginalis G3]|eukprot:XP_001317812.1 hypothetical protein [Trichomonas vaginalis G3]